MKYDDRYMSRIRRAKLLPFVTMVQGKLPTINSTLLTALVDCWRPETHTFHLPSGEITVTLRDVQLILGLPIAGQAVTGEIDTENWASRMEQLLGVAPPVGTDGGVQEDPQTMVVALKMRTRTVLKPMVVAL
jgi:hypothetical protein